MQIVRVVTFNSLFGGHADQGDGPGKRWEAMMWFLRRLQPDVLALQECNGWHRRGRERLHRAVNDFGLARGFLAEANRTTAGHRFHLATLLSDRVRVHAEDAERDGFHHAMAWARLRLPGIADLVDLRNIHLNPFDPRGRAREVAPFEVLAAADRLSLVIGDSNSIGLGFPEPDWKGMPPHLLNGHLLPPGQEERSDREALELLARAGFVDASSLFGQEHVPTGGFGEKDVPRRMDLILASPRLAAAITDYRVHREPVEEGFSDHAAVSVDIDLERLAA